MNSAFLEESRGSAANFDLICFLSQQGVEKLIKGALISHNVVVPKSHDLVQLHRMLAAIESRWSWDEAELQWLSISAAAYRYPGEDADEETAHRAANIARRVRDAMASLLPMR